jgi:hypothetical protein
MKTVKATMQWKGRKLLANGAYVCGIYPIAKGQWWADFPGEWKSAALARRAVNKRFKLPLTFGEVQP